MVSLFIRGVTFFLQHASVNSIYAPFSGNETVYSLDYCDGSVKLTVSWQDWPNFWITFRFAVQLQYWRTGQWQRHFTGCWLKAFNFSACWWRRSCPWKSISIHTWHLAGEWAGCRWLHGPFVRKSTRTEAAGRFITIRFMSGLFDCLYWCQSWSV